MQRQNELASKVGAHEQTIQVLQSKELLLTQQLQDKEHLLDKQERETVKRQEDHSSKLRQLQTQMQTDKDALTAKVSHLKAEH